MKFLGAVVTAALLLGGTATVRADEPLPAPAPTTPMSVGPAGPSCSGCVSPCGSCNAGCCQGDHSGKLWEWLTYSPLHRARCGECDACCCGCLPRPYQYFLHSCGEYNGGSCGCGHGCGGCGSH